jgi:ABC-type lipoprotein release transport system permease subunit
VNFSFYIAKRYLISKKSHNAINIISAISVLAISIGTAALVIILSALNGLTGLVESLYNSFDADIRIVVAEGKVFDPTSPGFSEIKKIKGVKYYTEVLEENVLLKYQDVQSIATIKGVGPEFGQMTRFDTLVREGEYKLRDRNVDMAVLGIGVGYTLNVNTSDMYTPLTVLSPKRGEIGPTEDAFNEEKTYVAGIFSINDDFDKRYALVSIEFARKLLEYTNEVSAIELSLEPGAKAGNVKEEVQRILGDKYVVKDRFEQNELLFRTLKSEKLWTFIILVFILIIATFNVIGSLTMLIVEKKKDIGILWNMGADIKLIRRIFLVEGLMITLIGALTGLLLGLIICWLQIEFKLVRFSEGYVVDSYPIAVQLSDLGMIMLVVMLIGLFAAWYPVRVFTKRHLGAMANAES